MSWKRLLEVGALVLLAVLAGLAGCIIEHIAPHVSSKRAAIGLTLMLFGFCGVAVMVLQRVSR